MHPKPRILVVDDDPIVRQSCQRVLAEAYEVRLVKNGRQGLECLGEEACDLALVDLKLPDISGMDILEQSPDRFPDVPIVIITGYSTVKSAVEAIKAGAFDYLAKPFAPHELEATVEKALRQRKLLKGYRHLQEELSDRYRPSQLVGQSQSMKKVASLIEQVAATDSTVLITGESGTGKELVARAIHFSGPMQDAPFVAMDCGAISPSLIGSELFGHVKGAFTGATQDREGLVQAANGGTLFLDEISNLPLDLQATLLRVIETGEVRAVGAPGPVKVAVRYVAASNRNLKSMAAEGQFREDLYYRLNVFPIHLPPLRERRDDIRLLAEHFLQRSSARMHKNIEGFTVEALEALADYGWPGNVRELSNVVERLVILCSESVVGRARLSESMAFSAGGTSVPQTIGELNARRQTLREEAVSDVERGFLLEALRRNDFNVTKAAAQTGMQRSNFQAMLKKHGLRIKDILTGG